MEPMTIGTPNTSQNASALFDSTAASNSQFLPSFLLGSDHGNDSLYMSPKAASPTKSQYNSYQPTLSHSIFTDKNTTQSSFSAAEKHDGPPIISLADYSVSQPLSITANDPDLTHNASFRDLQSEDFTDNWVTIFGFNQSQLDLILSYFVRYGQIVDKQYPPNGVNWIHVKYSNRREAQAALSQNGKQISSNLMVGVVSRKDKRHLENIANRSLPYQSRVETSQRQILTSPTSIRRLTVNSNENDVVQLSNIPTKSSGVVTKAMEYLFGW